MRKILSIKVLVIFLLFIAQSAQLQTYRVRGKISSGSTAVRYASIKFFDASDPSKYFSAITDNVGNYQLDIITSVRNEPVIPQTIELAQNYPNPFSSETAITYKLKKTSDVSIKIFNILGQEVKSFQVGRQENGVQGIRWDARNNFGEKVSPGIYLCIVKGGSEIYVNKMVFTGGGSFSVPQVSGFSYYQSPYDTEIEKLDKILKKQATSELFRIRVTNIDKTQPKISVREFYGINIEKDTLINLNVNKATNYNKYLYVGNWEYDQVFVIDTDNDSIVDTLQGFKSVNEVLLTNSGRKLYVATSRYSIYPYNTVYAASVYSVNPFTRAKTKILDRRAMICLEPNGIPLIIASSTTRDTELGTDTMRLVGTIDTLTDAVSFFDTLDIFHGTLSGAYKSLVFDPGKPIFYTFTNQNQLFAYNYKERKIVRYYTSRNLPCNIVISKDGKYIYCANGQVLDVTNDSIVGWLLGNNESSLASLALSPDGKYLYLTDPGNPYNFELVPSGKINVFRTEPFSYTDFIDVNRASGHPYTMTDGIIICPDGSRAYASANFSDIIVIDLIINQVVDMIRFLPRNIWLRSLGIGAKWNPVP